MSNPKFENLPLKIKLTYILLSCLGQAFRIGDSDKQISKRLKVEHEFDPKRIRSCIDLIQDTEEAILSFSKYGLQKFSFENNRGDGELYLRLYGILNAIYLQINSIIELYEVLKIKNKNNIISQLKNLKIFEIRNVVGAHTINLKESENPSHANFKKNFFRITQMKLTAKSENMDAVDGFGNIREYNLYNSVIDYNKTSEEILYNGVFEYFDKVEKSEKVKRELMKHYEIEGLNHFDYKVLYQNEILLSRKLAEYKAELKKDNSFQDSDNEDWLKSLSEDAIQDLIFTNLDDKNNE